MRTTAAACQISPIRLTAQKYQCFVLWRNKSIPKSPPTAPPKKEKPKSTRSGMRHLPRFALDLSAPYRQNETREIAAKSAQTRIRYKPFSSVSSKFYRYVI